jgi:hypothetical protein
MGSTNARVRPFVPPPPDVLKMEGIILEPQGFAPNKEGKA